MTLLLEFLQLNCAFFVYFTSGSPSGVWVYRWSRRRTDNKCWRRQSMCIL